MERWINVPGRGRVAVEIVDADGPQGRAMQGSSLPELQIVVDQRVVAVSAGVRSPSALIEWIRRSLAGRAVL